MKHDLLEAPQETLSALGLDPALAVLGDAGAMLDSRLLSCLHSEIEGQLGASEARAILLQIGFLNGLRDAHRVMGKVFSPGSGPREHATSALALRYRVNPGAEPRGAIEVTGTWPERNEAAARLGSGGVRESCCCYLSAGYTSGWLSGAFDADILALETSCAATGADACRFLAREAAAWGGDACAQEALGQLPFQAFRSFVESEAPGAAVATAESASLDREASVVHIWGPVMVIPFEGPDEAIRAVELIGRDPSAREVSVVVVDLNHALLDDAFSAVALERIVELAEAWGAETIFAEVSPLSEPVVAELERPPILVHKDLDAAIAAAFQIARSQRACL